LTPLGSREARSGTSSLNVIRVKKLLRQKFLENMVGGGELLYLRPGCTREREKKEREEDNAKPE